MTCDAKVNLYCKLFLPLVRGRPGCRKMTHSLFTNLIVPCHMSNGRDCEQTLNFVQPYVSEGHEVAFYKKFHMR